MKGDFSLVYCKHSHADKKIKKNPPMLPEESVPERDDLIGDQVHYSQLLQADSHHSLPHLPASKPDSFTLDPPDGCLLS